MPDNPIICPSCGHVNPARSKTCDICTLPLSAKPGTWDEATCAVGSAMQQPGESTFAPGALIAYRYEVLRELGRGGMGAVYLVADDKLERKEMALKVISPNLVESPEMRKRFVHEVLSAQELTHESIVKVFHLDEYQGLRFFTMEYLPGKSLREVMTSRFDTGRFFSIKESTAVLSPVLSALSHAHAKNVIHRDLKPENIIINGDFPDITVKVLDFGLARIMSPSRMTSSAVAMGTAYYMSPEQLSGRGEVDHRTDLFAVGVILYELLTGDIPTGRFKLPRELIDGLPSEIDKVVDKSLATKPMDRFQTASEFDTAIHQLSDAQIAAREAERKRKQAKKEERQAALERFSEAKSAIAAAQALCPDSPEIASLEEKTNHAGEQAALRALKQKKARHLGMVISLMVAVVMVAGYLMWPDKNPFVSPVPSATERRAEAPSESHPSNRSVTPATVRPPEPSQPPASSQYNLTVRPTPSDARVRIMNIIPRYHDGITLEPGNYNIEVSKQGYKTFDQWVSLTNRDKVLQVGLTPIRAATPSAPPKEVTNSFGMKFVYIGPGTFMMGSPSNEPGRNADQERQHRVTLTKGYYMQTTPVTVSQWRAFIQDTGYKTEAETDGGAWVWTGSKLEKKPGIYWANPGFLQADSHPVTCVSWNDVQNYIAWLNRKDTGTYRLPTEAEWEYAARAGSTTAYHFGNSESDLSRHAWYHANSGGRTNLVGQKLPNAWGLYDVHGNAWEWVADWYGNYPTSAVIDPPGPTSGAYRVLRGGGWRNTAKGCRSAYRGWVSPGNRSILFGFRLARHPGQPSGR